MHLSYTQFPLAFIVGPSPRNERSRKKGGYEGRIQGTVKRMSLAHTQEVIISILSIPKLSSKKTGEL